MMWDMGDMEAELQTQHQANHWDAPMQEQTNSTTWLTRIRRQSAELECRLLQIDNCDNCLKIFNFFNVRLWQHKDRLQTQMRIICLNLLLLTCPNAFVWIAQQLLYSNLTSLLDGDWHMQSLLKLQQRHMLLTCQTFLTNDSSSVQTSTMPVQLAPGWGGFAFGNVAKTAQLSLARCPHCTSFHTCCLQ